MESRDISEFDLFDFFEKTPDLVCIATKEGFFKKVNLAVLDKLGYTKEELFAQEISSFVHPDDQLQTGITRQKMLNGEALLNFENRYLAKNGGIVWLSWTSIYFPDKEVVFAIAKDITHKKFVETEIVQKYKQFKNLATHFKSTIEEDRRYLATELHEELAQLVAVLKMDIEAISNSLSDLPEPTRQRMEHAQVMSDLLIKTIRRVSFAISPNMLDYFGLNETLQRHCTEFSMLNGIACSFETSYEEADLSQEGKIDFFRVCQEALINVIAHAQAANVTINIRDVDGNIVLTIRDNGKGFNVQEQKVKSGLTNMRERAASINGSLTVNSEIGKGTTVQLAIAKN